MARHERISQSKNRDDYDQRQRQRTLRRNQIIFAIFSFFLILSMILALVSY